MEDNSDKGFIADSEFQEGVRNVSDSFYRSRHLFIGAMTVGLAIASEAMGKAAWREIGQGIATRSPSLLASGRTVLALTNGISSWVVPALAGFTGGYIVGVAGVCAVDPESY